MSETKTHEEAITKLRSSVMRCLLRRDKYVATPHLLLSLVASPSLNPFYSRVMDGLMVAWRAMRFSGSSDEVKLLFQQGGGDFDGPVARLLQIDSMPDFKGCVRALFDLEPSQVGKWMHEVRDKWRLAQWKKLARDRAVFKGIEKGILREITMRYLRRLEREGSSGPFEAGGPAHEQARMKAAVLRLLLCGGLFTRDVISQHKFQTTTECDCAVGGTLDVFHVSWTCAHYAELRRPISHLSRRIRRAKSCFRYATIVCNADSDLADCVELIQQTLVTIWQTQIRSYLYGDADLGQHVSAPAADVPATVSIDSGDNAIHENGHYIVSMLGGGVWCRKCGVFVREPKHRRLKISYRRCTQIDLDRQYWLSSPSFQQNPHRALDLYRTMLEISNGHDLAWNASMSRTVPFGQLRCLRCGVTHKWASRHNVKYHQSCRSRGSSQRSLTPPGWISPRMLQHDFGNALQRVIQAHESCAMPANFSDSILVDRQRNTHRVDESAEFRSGASWGKGEGKGSHPPYSS